MSKNKLQIQVPLEPHLRNKYIAVSTQMTTLESYTTNLFFEMNNKKPLIDYLTDDEGNFIIFAGPGSVQRTNIVIHNKELISLLYTIKDESDRSMPQIVYSLIRIGIENIKPVDTDFTDLVIDNDELDLLVN